MPRRDFELSNAYTHCIQGFKLFQRYETTKPHKLLGAPAHREGGSMPELLPAPRALLRLSMHSYFHLAH